MKAIDLSVISKISQSLESACKIRLSLGCFADG
jgi:hypothetical protein